MNRYDVEARATAKELSSASLSGNVGRLCRCGLSARKKYVAERIRLHQPMKKAADIVSALRGFFKDRGSLPSEIFRGILPDPVSVAKPFPPVPSEPQK